MCVTGIHRRYVAQASWTASLRRQIFPELKLQPTDRILEVGCGTGAISAETAMHHSGPIVGIDIDPVAIAFACKQDRSSDYARADAFHLPFPADIFRVVYCHFLLLWLADPVQALREMQRVCIPGGLVLALAEPDYANRIDYPDTLEILGRLQREALLDQGANPDIGRQLRAIFHQAGLQGVRAGLFGGEWLDNLHPEWLQSEHETLQRDLESHLPASELNRLLSLDRLAWQKGERILFVPTFHAIGRA